MIYTETPEVSKGKVFCFHQTGQRHIHDGMECEDISVVIEHDNYLFFGLADGQSGKKRCKEGGKAVLTAVSAFLESKGIHCLSQYEYLDELQYELIRVIRETLCSLSKEFQSEPLDFSSTLVAFAVDRSTKEYITVHIGDGAAIAVLHDESFMMLSGPENGITSQYTWLTTSGDLLQHIRIHRGSIRKMRHILMVTDGATMICRGRAITEKAKYLLNDVRVPEALENLIRCSSPQDDASCIWADWG